MFNNSSIVWKSLLEQTKINITKTKDLFNQTKDLHITGLDKTNHAKIQSDVQSLLHHLKSGKGFGFGVFKNKIIKETEYIWSKVKIDGKIAKDLSSLEKLLKIVQLTSILDKLQKDWSFSIIVSQLYQY